MNQNKTVWIMNHYAAHMYFDKGGRHYYFAKHLKERGYNPVVFCCNTKEDIAEQFVETNKQWEVINDEENGIPWVFINSSFYKGNGFSRVRNMTVFAKRLKSIGKVYAKQFGKPGIIIASSVHPLTLLAGIKLAKHFGVKCICEIRDLWPMSIFEHMPALKKYTLLSKLLYSGERKIYEKADALIFTCEGGKQYISDKGWDISHGGKIDLNKVFYINNGIDLQAYDNNIKNNQFYDPDLDNTTSIKLIYTGSIRKANNIDMLLDIAKKVKTPNAVFLIYGAGDYVEKVTSRIKEEKISNVLYKGVVKKNEIPYVLSKASFTIMHWRTTGVSKYGESLNKSFEYYAAGKPVIYTVQPGYSIAEKYHCGFITKKTIPDEIAEDIDEYINIQTDDYNEMCKNARFAAEHFDFRKHTSTLISIIETVTN